MVRPISEQQLAALASSSHRPNALRRPASSANAADQEVGPEDDVAVRLRLEASREALASSAALLRGAGAAACRAADARAGGAADGAGSPTGNSPLSSGRKLADAREASQGSGRPPLGCTAAH